MKSLYKTYCGGLNINRMHKDPHKIIAEKYQTEFLKIKIGFAVIMPKRPKMNTRMPAELRFSEFSLSFLSYKYYI